jgi:septation ring formation regulator EzrA
MVDWLRKHHDAEKELEKTIFHLEKLADAFIFTGNKEVGEDLLYIADVIETSRKNMQQAVTESINEGYKAAQENSANVVKCLLGVI